MGVTSQQMSLLSDAEIEQRLSGAADWRAGEGRTIVRDIQFANFADAMAFVNGVAQVAEIANHHPDILLHGWNKVRLTLSTHSQGGLTDADFELAARIDGLA
jgi:4a-hydroxytetrahydrobiopterin dehydratase